ncbi:MAG: hypothetical protein HRT47_02070 [Candidatus Caenarcaniphilales bacterium]|nr:hypothetical protein [Candidatus Caenarcaniphilales bacterium]
MNRPYIPPAQESFPKDEWSKDETEFLNELSDDSLAKELALYTNVDEVPSEESTGTSNLSRKYRFLGYAGASMLHLFAAAARFIGFGEEKVNLFEKVALRTSKAVHTLAYAVLAHQAFKDNRALDALAKALDPLISNFFSIENINLSKGISGGLQLLDFSQASFNDLSSNLKENLGRSIKLTKSMAKEIYNKDLFTKNRKVFVAPHKEKGHSLALSGHFVLLSSILGLAFKELNKPMDLLRVFSSMASNAVAIQHPDSQKNVSGLLFTIYGVLDSTQKLVTKNQANFINQLNMAIYDFAIFLYGDLSNKRSNSEFHNYQ